MKGLKKLFRILKEIKIKSTMETYFQKPVTFMYIWLNYCDENYHIGRIPVAVKTYTTFLIGPVK